MDKKLADLLFTTRWAIKAGKPEAAYDNVTKALEHIGALRPVVIEPDRPDNQAPDESNKQFTEPEFVIVKGVQFDDFRYKTAGGMFSGLVVHYTVSGRSAKNAVGVVNYLAKQGLGCMVMDEDGKIYIPEGFDIFKEGAYHAGTSRWNGLTGVSQFFAGMEICCWGKGSKFGPIRSSKGEDNIIAGDYQEYTQAQEKSLINFCLWAKDKNKEFKFENVCGHDEIRAQAGAKGSKTDPGASLSMTMPRLRQLLENH